MNNTKTRLAQFILPLLLGTFTCMVCHNSIFYNIGLFEATNVLVDGIADKISLPDDGIAAVSARLRAEGFGQVRNRANGKTLVLNWVSADGMTYDGSPKFNAYYKGAAGGARLMAYLSGGKIWLHGFGNENDFNCLFTAVDPPKPVVVEEPPVPETRPAVHVAVNKSPTLKNGSGQPLLVNQNISPTKARAKNFDNAKPVEHPDPIAELKIPPSVQPWLGKWAGGEMSMNISYSGGKLRVGKTEARLKGGELVFIKETQFGRPIWVTLNFSDGLLLAKEAGQYGEVLQTAVLKR